MQARKRAASAGVQCFCSGCASASRRSVDGIDVHPPGHLDLVVAERPERGEHAVLAGVADELGRLADVTVYVDPCPAVAALAGDLGVDRLDPVEHVLAVGAVQRAGLRVAVVQAAS